MIIKKYSEIKKYINEGDVILFRGKGLFSKLIGSYTETPYSHVGLASWVNGNSNTDEGVLEILEFTEGSGGRAVNFEQMVKKNPKKIDIYRPNPSFFIIEYSEKENKTIIKEKIFSGKTVTTIMRKMTGLPYGWKRIWWIFRHKLFLYKIFMDTNKLRLDSLGGEMIYPVCSTAVAYSFNCNGYDLVKNRSDERTEPGEIAKSTQLNYLFTLE